MSKSLSNFLSAWYSEKRTINPNLTCTLGQRCSPPPQHQAPGKRSWDQFEPSSGFAFQPPLLPRQVHCHPDIIYLGQYIMCIKFPGTPTKCLCCHIVAVLYGSGNRNKFTSWRLLQRSSSTNASSCFSSCIQYDKELPKSNIKCTMRNTIILKISKFNLVISWRRNSPCLIGSKLR